jgi:hypothetical protein
MLLLNLLARIHQYRIETDLSDRIAQFPDRHRLVGEYREPIFQTRRRQEVGAVDMAYENTATI